MRNALPHLAALLVILACTRLAFWQLERAEEKTQLMDQWANTEQINLNEWLSTQPFDALPMYSQVELLGQFDGQRHIMLDNQIRHHHAGVHVFTPFAVEGHALMVLVNRGWQPWQRRAADWPDFETSDQTLRLSGRLSPPPRPGVKLGSQPPLHPAQWPQLMTYLELPLVERALPQALATSVLLLDVSSPHHLSGDEWQMVIMGPERHRAYAFQWFVIATAVALIWLGLTVRRWQRR